MTRPRFLENSAIPIPGSKNRIVGMEPTLILIPRNLSKPAIRKFLSPLTRSFAESPPRLCPVPWNHRGRRGRDPNRRGCAHVLRTLIARLHAVPTYRIRVYSCISCFSFLIPSSHKFSTPTSCALSPMRLLCHVLPRCASTAYGHTSCEQPGLVAPRLSPNFSSVRRKKSEPTHSEPTRTCAFLFRGAPLHAPHASTLCSALLHPATHLLRAV